MQYNNRSRLPPPPPFGRGGGAAGYPRGHKQLYYAPPPPPPPFPPAPPPPPPERKYEVLMEAGRLAAEYLVAQGVLPPAALQRGAGSSGAWAAHPLPPPPLQQLQEPHGFYGRRRYEDEYSNNPGARPRRANGTSSSASSRDDYSSGSYNGRGKRKYEEYKRGYDSGRDREKERGRSSSNGWRKEEDEDEAPGFWRERRGSRWSDEVRSSVTEAVREEAPLTAKAVAGLDMEDNRSKIESSVDDIRKDTDAAPKVLEETEEGEMEDDSEALNSEPEVVEQEMDTDVNNASAGGVMNSEPKQLPDGKIQDEVPDEEAEDDDKISDEAALDHNTSDGEVTNVENDMHDGKKNLIDYCNFARAPTRARSVRPHRNVASVPGETAVVETVDPISSGQTSQMVIGESANESSLTNIESENREDQIYQENNNSGAVCAEPIESMRLQENGTSFVIENMAVDKVDAQPHVVQEYKEETSPSPSTDAHNESLMQETTLSPFTASQKDSLMQETDLSPLTANHKDSLIEETTLHNGDSLTQETDLSQTISSHENNLKLQFKEGTTICDIDVLPQDVDLIKLSDQKKIVGHDAGAEAVIKMEEGKVNQSSSLNLSDLELIGSTEFAAIHDSQALVQHSEVGSSVEPHNKQQEAPETFIGANTSSIDDLCQLPLENKDIQVIDIECGKPVEVGGFDSSESKNDMVCSSMDSMMDPGIHTDVLPGIQDGYSLEFSDFLGADISCYPSMQSDLHAGLGVNDSEGITVMDDPIYGSLTDIGFMDVWGQPTQDYDKFF